MNLNYDRKPIDNPFKTTAYNLKNRRKLSKSNIPFVEIKWVRAMKLIGEQL